MLPGKDSAKYDVAEAEERGDVARNLGQAAIRFAGVDALYSEQADIGSQEHGRLSKTL